MPYLDGLHSLYRAKRSPYQKLSSVCTRTALCGELYAATISSSNLHVTSLCSWIVHVPLPTCLRSGAVMCFFSMLTPARS